MKTVVWSDGSCNANGMRGRGGWAALIEQAGTVREISGSADGTTQHRMELTAVCEAFEALTGAIEVRTDTAYVEGPASPPDAAPVGATCPRQRWAPTCSRRRRSAIGAGRTSRASRANPDRLHSPGLLGEAEVAETETAS